MTISHHISDDLLMSYEAGSLSEGWSLAVATHLALCPECRMRARAAAAVGGALLESMDEVSVDDTALNNVLERIAARPQEVQHPAAAPHGAAIIPEPLRSYVGGDVDTIPWKRLGGTARHLPIKTTDGVTNARLLCVAAGTPVPHHGHRGTEMTVVLQGSLLDGDEVFRRGDIELADESISHQPSAGPEEDCICLAVTDAPLKFKSLMVRLAQPFLRI